MEHHSHVVRRPLPKGNLSHAGSGKRRDLKRYERAKTLRVFSETAWSA